MIDGADSQAIPGRQATALANLPALACISALLGFFALQVASFLHAGTFEYPLDDVYIHLAVAEQIAAGNYGVNPGEYASAASSPLYPLLLLPLAGSDAQRYVPLVWNLLALAGCGWLWGRILVQAGYANAGRGFGLALAVAVPILLNLPGVAYSGMEHCLHVGASLAVILGLLILLDEDRVAPLLLAGIVLGPALRFEGLALSGLAAGLLLVRGKWVAGLASGLGALAVVGAFMATLVSLGLDPLPSSVQAKLGGTSTASGLARVIGGFYDMVVRPNSWSLFAALLASVALSSLVPGMKSSPRRQLLSVLSLALLAHLAVGKVGWMNRYEIYILVASSAGLLALAAPGGWPARIAALLPVAIGGWIYVPYYVTPDLYPTATRTIDRQQAEMSRFAKEFHKAPVAVNDLGWVAWRNPGYVLDIWGLGSKEALELRRAGDTDRWVDVLVKRRDVDLAMIYDEWFVEHIGQDWVRLGQLEIEGAWFYAARPFVGFYATSPEAVPGLLDKIALWEADLPEGARFKANPQVSR